MAAEADPKGSAEVDGAAADNRGVGAAGQGATLGAGTIQGKKVAGAGARAGAGVGAGEKAAPDDAGAEV
jgi:hypothetical protein